MDLEDSERDREGENAGNKAIRQVELSGKANQLSRRCAIKWPLLCQIDLLPKPLVSA